MIDKKVVYCNCALPYALLSLQYPTTERGDMLIFLSGMTDIAALLQETRAYAQKTGHWIIIPLHSALSVEEQDRVSVCCVCMC